MGIANDLLVAELSAGTLGGAPGPRIPQIGEVVLAMLGAAVVKLGMPLADVAPLYREK